jgi:hypothetical protein
MLPDFERADRIGELWGLPGESRLRRTADRLRGDGAARAVVFGLLAQMERK